MQVNTLLEKALRHEWLTIEEGSFLFHQATLTSLMEVANNLRKIYVPHNNVTWIIDRNVNLTNICISRCRFCNFHRLKSDDDAYVTCFDEYKKKIEELYALGGNQLLLQGGMHPDLTLDFYTSLFKNLKTMFPSLILHALGPAEIVHLSKVENISYKEILIALTSAGMNSLPGAGAEILSDRVRQFVSPAKCTSDEWLDVMRVAHQLNILTTATMMFGHYENIDERFEHLAKIRQVQSEKPEDSIGFIAFIPWPFQDVNTKLRNVYVIKNHVHPDEYIRMLAMSRIMLCNIQNIQASWLTVGIPVAQVCLHAGANDLGSIMIEENVVSAAGAVYRTNAAEIQSAISKAGFEPRRRNQQYEFL